jgi:hypothetical protein
MFFKKSGCSEKKKKNQMQCNIYIYIYQKKQGRAVMKAMAAAVAGRHVQWLHCCIGDIKINSEGGLYIQNSERMTIK